MSKELEAFDSFMVSKGFASNYPQKQNPKCPKCGGKTRPSKLHKNQFLCEPCFKGGEGYV